LDLGPIGAFSDWFGDMRGTSTVTTPHLRSDAASAKAENRRSVLSALCQFTVGSILHLQRKSGMTGRTAASQHLVE
jgi:hypothetical protein